MHPILLTHCGAGSNASVRDAASAAGAIGIAVLRRGGRALDAVVESIAVLEDDPRLNAGTGSRMRIDGRIQMDAALMDADLEAGGVAAIEEVKNPIRVARDVFGTPHVLLVGSDATAFARKMGHVRYDPATPESRRRLKESLTQIRKGRVPRYARKWKSVQLAGTVGAVARDRRGRFAAGTSTGGTAFMLPGRVGDSPIVGAGLYAGPHGAGVVEVRLRPDRGRPLGPTCRGSGRRSLPENGPRRSHRHRAARLGRGVQSAHGVLRIDGASNVLRTATLSRTMSRCVGEGVRDPQERADQQD